MRPDDILVVEDDADLIELVLLALGEAGYAVRGARNGREGLAAVAAQMPALILLDMSMPVMDGWRFARELRARYQSPAPIVVVTAAEHAEERARTIAAAGWIAKPFDVGGLVQEVARFGPSRAAQPAPMGG
jgi:CheY-like chemotaxis protein